MRSLLFLAIVIFSYGCAQNSNDCNKVMCTMLFASVNCTLSDTTNPSLTGISTQTVIVLSGQIVHEQSGPGSIPDSSFVVVDDAALKTLGLQKEQKVLFKISKNGTLIKSAEFTIKTDCCHVGKSAGPDKIPLN